MGTLTRRWFDRLWRVQRPSEAIEAPLDCDACRAARAEGRDACGAHHTHLRAHRYAVGDEIHYASGLDSSGMRGDSDLP